MSDDTAPTRDDHYCCPHCQASLRYGPAVGHTAPPNPDDLSVCADCGAGFAFTEMGTRLATEPERQILRTAMPWRPQDDHA